MVGKYSRKEKQNRINGMAESPPAVFLFAGQVTRQNYSVNFSAKLSGKTIRDKG